MKQTDRLKALERRVAAAISVSESRARRTKGRLAFRYSVLTAALVKAREALQAVLEDEGVGTTRAVGMMQ